jgi:spore coat polysaccharide biosynthesis protein SpsF (cytidylyltransferase family)
MDVVVITQARTGSSRLPNKVLKRIQGKTLLQIHIDRIKQAREVDDIYIATTTQKEDDTIVKLANTLNIKSSRGSKEDVLDRFYQTVKNIKPKFIVRLTSDCPLIDPKLLDEVISQAKNQDLDYYANIIEERYPDGQDIEVFKFTALEKAHSETILKSDREHVTTYIRNNSSCKGGKLFRSNNHGLEQNYNHVRLTVDEPQDLEVIRQIIKDLGFDKGWKTYADHYLKTPQIKALNSKIPRNEGYQKSVNQDKKKQLPNL